MQSTGQRSLRYLGIALILIALSVPPIALAMFPAIPSTAPANIMRGLLGGAFFLPPLLFLSGSMILAWINSKLAFAAFAVAVVIVLIAFAIAWYLAIYTIDPPLTLIAPERVAHQIILDLPAA